MEARLDRDKQELKEHIDQAHQRLDQKVSNLERRTQGQLSELTRCVAAERALCDQRHLHLAQWIRRGAAGRSSERVRETEPRGSMGPVPVPRARSLEQILDRQTEWRDQQEDTVSNANATGLNKGLRNNQDHRSMEILADKDGIASWKRCYLNSCHEVSCRDQNAQVYQSENKHEATIPNGQPNHTYAHELAFRLKQGVQKNPKFLKSKQEHNKSFETLLDENVTSWRGQPHRRSAHELLVPLTHNSESFNVQDKHNRSFDTLLDHRSSSWRHQTHYRSVHELPASQYQRSHEAVNGQGLCPSQHHNHGSDVFLEEGITSWRDQSQKRNVEMPTAREEDCIVSSHTSTSWKEKFQQETKEAEEQRHSDTQADNTSPDWKGQPLRRSVHEMVARFQGAQQASQIVRPSKIQNKLKSAVTATPKVPEVKHSEPPELLRFEGTRDNEWQSQNLQRAWQGEAVVVCGANRYVCHDDNGSSESSEGEDGDDEGMLRISEGGNPDYENVVASCPWQVEESRLMSGLPYRSRNAVYSPTQEPPDLHNDSGYSTKLYGSSKGPSPSLSG